MKLTYLIALLIAIVLVSSSFERRLRRKHRRHRHHYAEPPSNVKQSSIYQFIMAMVKEISDDPHVELALDECSGKIDGWQTVDAGNMNAEEQNVDNSEDTKKEFVEGMITKAIDSCCNLKDKIVAFLSKRYRRYLRLFAQGKIRRSFTKWGFTGLWESIKSAASSVATAVVSGAKVIGNAVNRAVEWTGKKWEEFTDYIKEKLSSVIEPLYARLKKWMEEKFQAWLDKHPVLKQIYNFTLCFIEHKGAIAIAKISNVFVGILKNIAALFLPGGWVKLIVNAICGWRLIKKGFDYLDIAKKESDPMKRAAYRGRAVADFLMVAAGETGSS